MRARIAIPIVLAGIFIALLPVLFRSQPAPAQHNAAVAPILPPLSPAMNPDGSPSHGARATGNAQAYQDYSRDRAEELNDLAMTGDPNSLTIIESELDNRDPRIQEAAVEAAVQFGSRDAIPSLEAAFWHTDDPEQKLKIQEAIDFLKLPTPDEAARNANRAGAE